MVLHRLQQGLNGLTAEVVLPAGRERVSLVNEEHAAQGGLNHFLRLKGGLAHIARHQARAVHFDQLALAQDADGRVQAADQAGDGGLAGAGVAEEDHVEAHRRDRKVVLLTELADLDKVDEVLDLLLHGLKAHQAVQLLHQLVEVRLLRFLLLRFRRVRTAAGGLDLGAVLLHEAGLAAGDKVQGIQAFAGLAHTGGVADGRQPVGAFGDELRLGIGHVVIHRREVEQDVGQHPDKGSGGLGAALGIGLRQIPEKHGRQEDVFLAHGAGQVPEQPLRLLPAAGVDLVCHLDMALADAAGSAPQGEGALGHEFIQLRGQIGTADPVKRVGVGQIDFMKFFRAAAPCCGHRCKASVSDSIMALRHAHAEFIIEQSARSVKKGTCKQGENMR